MTDPRRELKERIDRDDKAYHDKDGQVYVASSDMICRWRCWEVVGRCTLRVHLWPNDRTDGRGVVKIAKALMPRVMCIEVWHGGTFDVYQKQEDGKWRVFAGGQQVTKGGFEC